MSFNKLNSVQQDINHQVAFGRPYLNWFNMAFKFNK